MNRTYARAKVSVTLEIDVQDTWSANCGVDQIHKQAVESANFILGALLKDAKYVRLVPNSARYEIRIEGDKP